MKALKVVRDAASLRSIHALALTALAMVLAAAHLRAQTAGNPIVYTSGTPPTGTAASPAYLDAYIATGGASCTTNTYIANCSDICERINYAWSEAMGPSGNSIFSATVDARGFTGPSPAGGAWACSVSPFTPPFNKTFVAGELLLGSVNIDTTTTWYVPSQTRVLGIGSGGTGASSAAYNTIITNKGISSGPVIQMGPSTAGIAFGVGVEYLTIDCQGETYTGCTGILNNEAEENSEVHHVQIWDASGYGLHVSAYLSGNAFPAATNSGPYRDIDIEYSACTGCTSAIGLQVDGAGSTLGGTQTLERVIRQFDDITISGDGVTDNIATGAIIYGVSTAFTNSHIEFVNSGIQVGTTSANCAYGTAGNCETHGVILSNISIAPTNTSGHVSITVGNAANAAPLTGDVTLMGIANQSGAAYTLVDNVSNGSGSAVKLNGGLTPTAPWDPFIGFYAIGHCSTDSAGCTPTPTVKNTQ
jgi:hypothetical protein